MDPQIKPAAFFSEEAIKKLGTVDTPYSIGAFYRTEGDIGIMASAAVSPSFTLVYSYDSKLSPLNTYIKGSHEFGLQYMIPYVANGRVRVPRYF